jgi:signal transduction histidine kinase
VVSFRARLLLTVGAVVLLALAAVALLSSRVTHHAFLRLEEVRATKHLDDLPLRERLEAHYRGRGSWASVADVLASLAQERQEDLVLTGPDGAVVALSPGLAQARVTARPEGGLRIERRGARGREVVLVRMPSFPLRDAAGKPAGGVTPVLSGHERLEEQQQFFGSVDRWIFGGVAIAGVLALLATAALSKRILRPVEELTAAARRMEQGDRNARVDVRSRDEIGQLARAFNSMSETRRQAEDLRRRMVGDIAHELRTPLTNLRAQLEAIEDGLLPANADTLASLREETVLLARLVDDLQDLALAEAGQLRLDVSAVSVEEAARAAIAAMRPTAEEAGVKLEAEIAPGLPPARADRERLAQILRNLLANAITHSPRAGAVRVAARREGSQLEIAVSDDGPGIAPEHRERIFDRFYRVDPSRSRATGGAGLGLAIVRQLARAQGGDARVESEPGRGARFVVTLPFDSPLSS